MTKIPIAEDFYSVQGEGPYAGTPAVFLRLAGCNLSCGMTKSPVSEFEKGQDPEEGAEWICDTIDVWRAADRLSEPEELLDRWGGLGWTDALSERAHLVLTGGEPMMEKNQESILALIDAMEQGGLKPFVEVETNGTIKPFEELSPLIDQWNVSLKLANSGMAPTERFTEEAIDHFIHVHKQCSDISGKFACDATFKFVVGQREDLGDILDIQGHFGIPDSMIALMPAGQSQDVLRETYPLVAEMCKDHQWQFSPRLQVDAWGEVTGV